jgi:16S rRNA (cytosine967-C5)-methyltransferase
MKISPSRLAAYEILRRIETERSLSSALLPVYEESLSEVDRALCHELVLGVLRRQIYLDRVIESLAPKKLDVEVRIALRLGMYQIVFLDKVPAYSAINESVNLVQKAKKTSAKGLVNAVLRKISIQAPAIEYTDELDRISVETSHPTWLIEKWTEDVGAEAAEQIAIANNRPPRLAFRYSTRRGEGADRLDAEPSGNVEGCYFAAGMSRDLRAAADTGEIYFQDEGSQLVARAVGNVDGLRVLDLCAAPGGKTTQIALASDKSMIVAGDLRTPRVKLLRATCVKQGAEFVSIVQYDAETAIPFADESFDVVLVDAPCTGTGTIRHNPELRYFVDPEDFAELGSKQLRILENASKLLRSGGRLIYSTCSIQSEENEAVCDAFLNRSSGFRSCTPYVPEKFLTADGFARTFPHRDDMDGFFIAEFERA